MKKLKPAQQVSADTLHLMIQGSRDDRELQEDFPDNEHTGARYCVVAKPARRPGLIRVGADQKALCSPAHLQSDISSGLALPVPVKPALAVVLCGGSCWSVMKSSVSYWFVLRLKTRKSCVSCRGIANPEESIRTCVRLYDALYEMLGFEKVAKLIERQVRSKSCAPYLYAWPYLESFFRDSG